MPRINKRRLFPCAVPINAAATMLGCRPEVLRDFARRDLLPVYSSGGVKRFVLVEDLVLIGPH
jgi:hypothetical protein